MIKLKAKLLQANHEAGIMDQIIATGVKSWADVSDMEDDEAFLKGIGIQGKKAGSNRIQDAAILMQEELFPQGSVSNQGEGFSVSDGEQEVGFFWWSGGRAVGFRQTSFHIPESLQEDILDWLTVKGFKSSAADCTAHYIDWWKLKKGSKTAEDSDMMEFQSLQEYLEPMDVQFRKIAPGIVGFGGKGKRDSWVYVDQAMFYERDSWVYVDQAMFCVIIRDSCPAEIRDLVLDWAASEGLVKGEAAGWSDCEVYCKVPSKKKASPDDVFMAEDLQERIQDLQDRMGRIKILKLIPWISVSTKDMADRERIPDEMLKHVHSERVKVPLQKVETDQEYISASKLNDLLNCPGILYKIAPPMAIRMPSGRYLIEDGNHRVVAALLEGADFLEMTVVDYRDVAQKRIAKLLKKAELNDAGCRVEALRIIHDLNDALPLDGAEFTKEAAPAFDGEITVKRRRDEVSFETEGADLTVTIHENCAFVINLYVKPERRNKGIASALYREFVTWAKANGVEWLHGQLENEDGVPYKIRQALPGTVSSMWVSPRALFRAMDELGLESDDVDYDPEGGEDEERPEGVAHDWFRLYDIPANLQAVLARMGTNEADCYLQMTTKVASSEEKLPIPWELGRDLTLNLGGYPNKNFVTDSSGAILGYFIGYAGEIVFVFRSNCESNVREDISDWLLTKGFEEAPNGDGSFSKFAGRKVSEVIGAEDLLERLEVVGSQRQAQETFMNK